MKDFSSCGYLQAPIRALAQQDLERLGISLYSSGRRKSKSHTQFNQVINTADNVSIYGRSLSALETRPVPGQPYLRVPRLLLRSCNFLSHHLETEGLFRKSGSVARQKLIRGHLNDGKAIEEDSNPHDVANLLKQFLRELPDPLLSYELYDGFIQTQLLELTEDQIHSTLLMILLLPDIQRHSLQFLVQFLHTCSLHSDVNKMTVSNIAVVTSPNIMKHPSGDCSKIKLENALMECLIENSSEVGLVTDELFHRAQAMLLELSTVWGISEEQAANKLPFKAKRKRSGSISGILSNVFKHGNLKTAKRKSFSNQDLSEVKVKGSHLLKNDLSCSTPCIKGQSSGMGSSGSMHTPLLNAHRRTHLLRQTPVDPRKKPKALAQSDNECDSPADSGKDHSSPTNHPQFAKDPPKKRSKLDFSPQTEPRKEKRKTMKQRLSEGLRSKYRKDRIKQKRVQRSNTQLPTTPSIMKKIQLKKKDKTPVFCFKGQPGMGSFKNDRRLSSGREVVVNHCSERYFDSPASSPDLADYSPAGASPECFSDLVMTRSKSKMNLMGKKLFPAVQPESSTEEDSPERDEGEGRRNNSYLQSQYSIDLLEDLEPGPTPQPKSYLQQQIEETFSVKRERRLRRSAPIVGSPFQVDLQKYRHRSSETPVSRSSVETPVLRRSPRLSGNEPGPMLQGRLKDLRGLGSPASPLTHHELPHHELRGLINLSVPKRRSVSGNSFTAVKMSQQPPGLLNDTPPSLTPPTLTPPSLGNSLDTSLENSREMAALITPASFSSKSRVSRSNSRGANTSTRISLPHFSPIPISLSKNIRYQEAGPSVDEMTPTSLRSRQSSNERSFSFQQRPRQTSKESQRESLASQRESLASQRSRQSSNEVSMSSRSRQSSNEVSISSRSRQSSKDSAIANLTEMFNSRDITVLDLSLTMPDFDFQFKQPTNTTSTDNILPDFTMTELAAESTNIAETTNISMMLNIAESTNIAESSKLQDISANLHNISVDINNIINSFSPDVSPNKDVYREASYNEHETTLDDSRVTYITQNLSSFQNKSEIDCPKFNAQIEGLSLFNETMVDNNNVAFATTNNNNVTMVTTNNVTMVTTNNMATEPQRERVRSSDRLKRKSSDLITNNSHSVSTPRRSETLKGRKATPGPPPGTPLNFAEVVEPDRIRNAVVMQRKRSSEGSSRNSSDCDTSQPSSSRYLTRTTSERTHQPISNALKVTQSDQTLAKPDFVLQDSHISSSCDLSISDEEIEDKMEDKENKLKSLTPSNNGNELDTTKINITPRTKITRGHTKNLASQWEDRSNNSKFKSTRNNKMKTVSSRTTRSKSADPNNRLSRNPPAVKTKRTPKATPCRSKTVNRTKSGEKSAAKPAWRF